MKREVESTTLLKKMAKDIGFMKQKLVVIESEVREIGEELLEVRPEYLEKIKKMEKEGTVSEEEFERKFNVRI